MSIQAAEGSMNLKTAALKPSSLSPCGGLNMLGPGSGTIRRCGLFAVGEALLNEVCHCRRGL